jgi:hypothetical protein
MSIFTTPFQIQDCQISLIFSQKLEFLPLFIMLVHVALFRTKIVVTHIAIGGVVLQFFAAARTGN